MKKITILFLFITSFVYSQKTFEDYVNWCNETVYDTIEQTGVVTFYPIMKDGEPIFQKDTSWEKIYCKKYAISPISDYTYYEDLSIDTILYNNRIAWGNDYLKWEDYCPLEHAKSLTKVIIRDKVCEMKRCYVDDSYQKFLKYKNEK